MTLDIDRYAPGRALLLLKSALTQKNAVLEIHGEFMNMLSVTLTDNLMQTLLTNRKWYYLERLATPYYLRYFDNSLLVGQMHFLQYPSQSIRSNALLEAIPLTKAMK